MVVDEDDGYLLGVTSVGPGVEELIHSATIAVAGQVPISRSAEEILNSLAEYMAKISGATH
jgi:pyruvate/2-oxoglutarate dehydrogenase complex dihydrolipoamide dehydrogenase (E3) component